MQIACYFQMHSLGLYYQDVLIMAGLKSETAQHLAGTKPFETENAPVDSNGLPYI